MMVAMLLLCCCYAAAMLLRGDDDGGYAAAMLLRGDGDGGYAAAMLLLVNTSCSPCKQSSSSANDDGSHSCNSQCDASGAVKYDRHCDEMGKRRDEMRRERVIQGGKDGGGGGGGREREREREREKICIY